MKITLRRRTTKAGTVTLYLDCYDRGRRWLEYLGLYLSGERHEDKETLRVADARAAQRRLEVFSDRHGLHSPTKQKGDFIEYCRKLGEGKRASNTRLVWKNAILRLEAFAGGPLQFERVDASFLEGFRDDLLKDLKPNSAAVYLARIKTACRQATKARIFARNPAENLTSIGKQDSQRVFLTLPELRKLNRTECGNSVVKEAFLFAAFSGLRNCDVRPLTWRRVQRKGRTWSLEFTQVKTGDSEFLPLSREATSILRRAAKAKTDPDSAVFALPAQQTVDKALKRWAKLAGLEKKISYHCGRHTFATLALTSGADIYTVSKLLGHRDVSTTQIYARVVDEKKRDAVDLLPTL